MWERLLEPELAFSYRGLFDYMPTSDGKAYYLSSAASDPAFDYYYCWCEANVLADAVNEEPDVKE